MVDSRGELHIHILILCIVKFAQFALTDELIKYLKPFPLQVGIEACLDRIFNFVTRFAGMLGDERLLVLAI